MTELATNFDTRPSVERLVATGVPMEQAEAVIKECVSHITKQIEASYANLATKQDIATLQIAMTERIAQLQAEINERIAQLQVEMTERIAQTNERIAQLQAETNERIAQTNERIAQLQLETTRLLVQQHKETQNTLKWGAGFVIATIVAMATLA